MHPILTSYFNFIKKCLPKDSENISIGLDIDDNECRFIALSKEDDRFLISNWAIEPVEKNNVKDSIEKIFSKVSSPISNICTTVYGKGTLTRYIDMPRMSYGDLKNAFALEADKYFPFPQDQIYTDCYITNPEEKSKRMFVMAVAAKKDIVDKKISLLEELGLKTNFVGTNSAVLLNTMDFLGYPKGTDKGHAFAILNIGHSVSSLNITSNKVPQFTRDIFIGTDNIIQKISNSLGIDEKHAKAMLNDIEDKGQDIDSVYESSVLNIIQEIKLSFDYFSTERNIGIDSIAITGEGRYFNRIYKMIIKNLDAKVLEWDPVSLLGISPDIDINNLKRNSHKLITAIGLALYYYD